MRKRNKFKKIIVGLLVASLLVTTNGGYALALDLAKPGSPSSPTEPTAPEEPSSPTSPDSPIAPDLPENFSNDEEEEGSSRDGDRRTSDEEEKDNEESADNTSTTPKEPENIAEPLTQSTYEDDKSGGETSDGNVGDTEINTGDATTTAGVTTTGNTNTSTKASGEEEGSIKVANKDNGADSENSASVDSDTEDVTIQINDATVVNNLEQESETGGNSASRNVGDSSITTGDANTTGTLITAVNTNIDGVMVNEFNIVDDHVGDLVLDFSSGCISGCLGGDVEVVNSGNGTGTVNDADVKTAVDSFTFQQNVADIENNMILESDSGGNDADRNTGGDSTIVTGDANVSANSLTFANNNLAGNVIYSVVNIFGDLIGDIIFPENYCCFSDVTAQNTGNGSESVNSADVDLSSTDTTIQFNQADIENNLILYANTGDNETNKNTGGTSTTKTGDTSVDAQVINIANNNISGGDMWLVIVNEAGNWIGRILGAPVGALFAGSDGFEVAENEAGEIIVTNAGNGSGSTNTGSVSHEVNNTTVQTNDAHIVNNLDLSANTGGNSTSRNTGGNNSITTGDANIVANLVNFVNNNIAGNGRLFVNVVNVFGSWFGDFVTPGQKKDETKSVAQSSGVGGSSEQSSTSSNNSNTSSSSGSGGEVSLAVNQVAGDSETKTKVVSSYNFNQSNNGSSTELVTEIADAGAGDEEVLGASDTMKRFRINLAWFVVGLPVLLLVLVGIRKRSLLLSLLPGKTGQ